MKIAMIIEAILIAILFVIVIYDVQKRYDHEPTRAFEAIVAWSICSLVVFFQGVKIIMMIRG